AVLCVRRERKHASRVSLGAVVVVVARHVAVHVRLQVRCPKRRFALVTGRLLRVVARLPLAENANQLVTTQRLLLGVEETCTLRLVPYPVVLKPLDVRHAEKRRERLTAEQSDGNLTLE